MAFSLNPRSLLIAAAIFSSLIVNESNADDSSVNEETRWTVFLEYVDPIILSHREERERRSARGKGDFDRGSETIVIAIGNWTLNTLPNDRLIVSPNLEMRWIGSEARSMRNYADCDVRQGHADNHVDSVVILTICADEFYIVLKINESNVFYVRPTDDGQRHILRQFKTPSNLDDSQFGKFAKFDRRDERVESIVEILENIRKYIDSLSRIGGESKLNRSMTIERNKRDDDSSLSCVGKAFYNLTGDTFDLGNETITVDYWKDKLENDEEFENKVEEPEIVEELAVEEDSVNVGYFFDRTWERTKLPRGNSNAAKESSPPPRWLELGIGVDYSVIEFHGERVQQYVLALLNIVSAIYKDPSLDSNLRLVIVRMIFYAEKKDGMVRQGNARKSLENVNKWNRKILSSTSENHDVAVWLTRLDIGGPSGYAPVSGTCDPARSCALNRDEGLTSAFIIAHEVAHILGLTHDGDETAGNSCGEESSMGSVMAPMVAATFHRFHWSTCSRKEFHRRAKHWRCLDNKPNNGNVTHLGDALRETFTMDEQCRMEFGDGYGLCRSFELPGPCSHLWCGQANSTQVCKTKKGPPLEGTACGRDKWCINGYCEPVDRKRFGFGPVINNVRNGGWSSWSLWGKCSRTCGIGVRFRFRNCNEPTPAFGGKYCEGNSEDFAICEEANCTIRIDLRQQQCSRLPSLVGLLETSPKFGITWLSHEPDQDHLKCRLSCRSAETGEIFVSQEFLTDGTSCTYGETDICVQGKCRRMGCDKNFNSEKKIDSCGVCEGDDSTCTKHINKYRRRIRRGMTRVSIIPRASYNVSVEVAIEEILGNNSNFTFTIRDGRKRRNDLVEFDSDGRAGQTAVIVEGAAFRYRKSGDRFIIWAKGSTLSEIVVSLATNEAAVKRGATIGVVSRYISDERETSKSEKFTWITGGWSPCSVSCGGGSRHKTVACKDVETGRVVNRKKCSLLSKPFQRTEKCNSFSCRFKWIPGPWEGCTTTCGNEGTQQRQLYCIHSSFLDDSVTRDNELTVYRMMVSPSRCRSDSTPIRRRECERSPCPGNWIFTDWSSCSRSCGRGIQTRMARCVPSEGNDGGERYECVGSTSPDQLRSCRGHGRRDTGCEYFCRRDKSKYCSLTSLKRYCTLAGYRRRCCRSCSGNSL